MILSLLFGIPPYGSIAFGIAHDLFSVSVKGKNVPKPIKNWPQCGVSSKILALLKKHGYEKPTPIQAQASQITNDSLLIAYGSDRL
jgi:hypothetical protein